MCFGNKAARDPSAAAPRPAALPAQQHTSSSMPDPPKTAAPAQDYQPPPGPPPPRPAQAQAQDPASAMGSADDYGPPPGPPPARQAGPAAGDWYAPPPGPPPAHTPANMGGDFAPPPGPPPSHAGPSISGGGGDNYAPPPGPPPSAAADYTAPPPGPPPSHHQPPPPQHNWQEVVPDTSLFPPPPDVFSGWERSPANNATEQEMEAGEAWCAMHPPGPPIDLDQDPSARAALAAHDLRLMRPQGFHGEIAWAGPGAWTVRTAHERCSDTTICAYPPLYCAREHSPLLFTYSSSGREQKGRRRTAYYEVQVLPDSRAEETSLSIGFAALPYPPFRLPGWHRGSVAVHGDDGHRYTNDLGGGCSFTEPFRRGDRYGIGITFTASSSAQGRLGAEVFFTRNGHLAGGWDLHEETDADQSGGVFGLEGYHDLSCAIGSFNRVSFEVIFDPARWMYQGVQQD